MATVKKNSKIDLYKFVAAPKPRAATGKGKEASREVALVQVFQVQTKAINNLGASLNSIAKSFTEFRETQFAIFKNIEAQTKTGFNPVFNLPTAPQNTGAESKEQKKLVPPSWLESIFDLIKGVILGVLAAGAVKWLSNKENREKTKEALEKLFDILGKITDFFGTVAYHAIDGLWQLLCNEDASWLDKFGGFVKGFVALGTGLLAIRWLKNPMKILKDFKGAFNGLSKSLFDAGKSLKGRLVKGGLLAAGVAAAAWAANEMFGNKGNQEKEYEEPEFKKGGRLPQRARGGFIQGPQSGYPVSLDGGRSTAFIGHGTEYVAQKANGGFVIPIDTPATRNNPGLMGRRVGEAGRMGYDLGGMFDKLPGYARGGSVKPTNNTNLEKETQKGLNTGLKGGGESAVIAAGRAILKKGFTVAEHPNFKKNSYSGSGANTGKGFVKDGGQRVGGHSRGSAHYKNLAIDVTDWRGGDWKGRTAQLAEQVFKNRKKLKATQIIHDPWGSWFAGQANKGRAIGGHPTHLHIAFAKGKGDSTAGLTSGTKSGGSGGNYNIKLAKLLANYEGIRENAYKDAVHGWKVPTIGIGATYYPKGFRLSGKVKKGDKITKEEAYWIKSKHIEEHRQRLYKEVGKAEYQKLPANVKAPLESKVFNYGSLGSTLVKLIKDANKSKDYSKIAAYFKNTLAKHNNRVNDWRRNDEAGIIETGKSKRVGISFTGEGSGESGDDTDIADGDDLNVDAEDTQTAQELLDPREAFGNFAKGLLGDKYTEDMDPFKATEGAATATGAGTPSTPDPGDGREKATPGQPSGAKSSSPTAANLTSPPGALAAGQRPDKSLSSSQWRTQQAARSEASAQGLTGAARDRYIAGRVMGQIPAPAGAVAGAPGSSSIMTSATTASVNARSDRLTSARQAVAAVAQLTEVQNAETQQIAAQAQQQATKIAQQSKPKEQFIPTGNGSSKPSLIAQLNPVGNILRQF
jgi:GH24 family phage-related lysozyme (muramidase)